MKLKPRPRAEVEAFWRERLSEERRSLPPSRNLPQVQYLKDPMRMAYRGRIYELLPVSYRDGIRAVQIQEAIVQAAEKADYEAYAGLLTNAVGLIRSGLRPHKPSWVVRLAWRCGWNPFKDATEMEIGEFLLGFSLRRTMPRG
jgi:hypothetical protein